MGQRRLLVALAALVLGFASFATESRANWTLNLGYHNPAVSTYGVNFLYLGSQWGFEAGIGWIDAHAATDDDDDKKNETAEANDADDDDDAGVAIAGDVDVKYFFRGGSVRPYAQLGVGAGIGADDDSGVGAGAGGLFVGLGLLAGSPSLYLYVAGSTGGSRDLRVEAGLGFDI